MNELKAASKRGRPPKFLGSEERVPRSLRLMPDIEVRLREAAEANHRSIAEELEFRVNQSFECLVVKPSSDIMESLSTEAAEKGRSVEEEALDVLSKGDIVKRIRDEVLSVASMKKQADFISNYLRQFRLGFIVGKVLQSVADSKISPAPLDEESIDKRLSAADRKSRLDIDAVKRIEADFEKSFGEGSIFEFTREYDDMVADVVRDAAQGKYLVFNGQIMPVPDEGDEVVIFTGKGVTAQES